MRKNGFTPSPWFFLPPDSEPSVSYRRSNLVAVAIVVFFAIGLLVIALVPEKSGSALATGHAQLRVGQRAAPVHQR